MKVIQIKQEKKNNDDHYWPFSQVNTAELNLDRPLDSMRNFGINKLNYEKASLANMDYSLTTELYSRTEHLPKEKEILFGQYLNIRDVEVFINDECFFGKMPCFHTRKLLDTYFFDQKETYYQPPKPVDVWKQYFKFNNYNYVNNGLDITRNVVQVDDFTSIIDCVTYEPEMSCQVEESKKPIEKCNGTILNPVEVVNQLLQLELIEQMDAELYVSNYNYFEANRQQIESENSAVWVASVNQKIISASNLEQLNVELSSIPNSDRAYIEYIEGD